MNYIKATSTHLAAIFNLTQETIQAVYPNYYPIAVVDFFCAHHSQAAIQADIDAGDVRILFDGDRLVGTGSRKGNQITRVFVVPSLQSRGYGSYIMQELEQEICQDYQEVLLDASLSAGHWYEKRGYQTLKHERLAVGNGAVLAYEVMQKNLPNPTSTINYEGKRFVVKGNAINGEVSAETVFAYHQSGEVLWADYAGGDIKKGFLIGSVAKNGSLNFYYQHLNDKMQVRLGKCHSTPHILENGKVELHEHWQWLDGKQEEGNSVIREDD
jgi:GNAT superfamily N-acetyltransferase